MTWSPRPVSAVKLGSFGMGAAWLGSATAHTTQGPGCSRPSRIADWGRVWPHAGNACRRALVSSSDTTMAMSSQRCAVPHRCKVAMVKSRAAWTDLASAPGVRVATRGKQVQPWAAGSGVSGQFPLATAAISTAGVSQRQPKLLAALPTGDDGCAGIAVRSNPAATAERAPLQPASFRMHVHFATGVCNGLLHTAFCICMCMCIGSVTLHLQRTIGGAEHGVHRYVSSWPHPGAQ